MSALQEVNRSKNVQQQFAERLYYRLKQHLGPAWREILGDTLDTFQEVVVNTTVEQDDGSTHTMYNERDSNLPVYTTHERMIDQCMDKINGKIHEAVMSDAGKALDGIELSDWIEFLFIAYDAEKINNAIANKVSE